MYVYMYRVVGGRVTHVSQGVGGGGVLPHI